MKSRAVRLEKVGREAKNVSDYTSKFYEILQASRKITIRYGRIGCRGKQVVKVLVTEHAADMLFDSKRLQKIGRGYVEVYTSTPLEQIEMSLQEA